MRWTGVIVGLFIIFHLADLTWGKAHPGTYVRGNVYYNTANSLQTWPIAFIYIFANIALGGAHLPRRVVDVPEPRHQQPEVQPTPPHVRDRSRRGRSWSAT